MWYGSYPYTSYQGVLPRTSGSKRNAHASEGSVVRVGRYLCVLACLVALSVAAPSVSAAPATQEPVPAMRLNAPAPPPVASPALRAAIVEGVERVFPAEVIERWPVQFVPLPDSAYLVSHPALYWRVEEEPAARAVVQELESLTPGWSTTVYNGPYGRGVYLTYRHES